MRTTMNLRGGGLLLACCLLLLAACAAPQPGRRGLAPEDLVWPPAPQQPRVRWEKEIRTSADAGVRRSWWRRVGDLVLGKEEESLIRPYGVLADAEGRIFVADTGAGLLHFFDPGKGKYLRIAGSEEVPFVSPINLTADHRGSVYLTDSGSAAVFRLQVPDGKPAPWITGIVQRPTGIAWNPVAGLLYVSDTTAHRIVALHPNGTEAFRFGTRGDRPGELNYPTDLAVDAQGRLIVVDALNARLQIFSPRGEPLAFIGEAGDVPGTFNKPKGVAVNSDGHIFVCDALQDSVQIFDDTGQFLLAFGKPGSGPGEFWMPSGVWIDGEDRIYVTDTYNQRLQVFHYLSENP